MTNRGIILRAVLALIGVAIVLFLLIIASAGKGSGLSPIFPAPVSPNGQNIFNLYVLISPLAIAVFVLVEVLLAVAILRFRRSLRPPGFVPPQYHGHTGLEVVWTLIPLGIVLVIALVSFFELQRDFQANASNFQYDEEIVVTGYQFGWQYDYSHEGITVKQDGSATGQVQVFEVPTGKTIRLRFQARDVIHSWWVPAVSGKTDAVPGYDNFNWLKIDRPGEWRGECAELCGVGHATMQIRLKAVDQAEFDTWVAGQKAKAQPAPSPSASAKPSPSPSPSPSASPSARPSP